MLKRLSSRLSAAVTLLRSVRRAPAGVQTVGGGCLAETQGYTWGGASVRELLVPHLRCAIGDECPSGATLISEQPSPHNWCVRVVFG